MQMQSSPKCRQCGSTRVKNLGRIPDGTSFAGQTLSPPWDGGSLYSCTHCHLGFRHPIRPMLEYERLYENASENLWTSGDLREDQRRVKLRISERLSTGRVLDVGCYDGALLYDLRPGIRKFGVEASLAAARSAQAKGVDVIARRIEDIERLEIQFDAICAVDVIEHVEKPKEFLTLLARRLTQDGFLIVSTGTLDSDAWRYAGGRYWYSSTPEHISFISIPWAHAAAAEIGLAVDSQEVFSYLRCDEGEATAERKAYFSAVRRSNAKMALISLLPGKLGRIAPRTAKGRAGLFEDHMILVFSKRQ